MNRTLSVSILALAIIAAGCGGSPVSVPSTPEGTVPAGSPNRMTRQISSSTRVWTASTTLGSQGVVALLSR